jgi:hypothetical protein
MKGRFTDNLDGPDQPEDKKQISIHILASAALDVVLSAVANR